MRCLLFRFFFPWFLSSMVLFAEEPKVVILGGGPAGLSCALYLSRANIDAYVVEGFKEGGLISQSHHVENWPGEVQISGTDLAKKMRDQVRKNGVTLLPSEAVSIDFSHRPYEVVIRDGITNKKKSLLASHLVIATGTSPNLLSIPGEKEYFGRGVSTCAICDGRLFSGKKVAIVGGGDSAVLDAEFLANIAKEVHIFVRKETFRSTEHRRKEQVLSKKNVFVHFGSTLEEIHGDGKKISSIAVNERGNKRSYEMNAVFLAIGAKPNTDILQGALDLTPSGHIQLLQGQKTSKEGVYAAGDIVDPVYKQAITASADGAKAAIEIERNFHASPYTEIRSEKHFAKTIENAKKKPVLVYCYAPWCSPCKQMAPLFAKAAKKHSDAYLFVKVNIEKLSEFVDKLSLSSLPTLLVFEEKQIQERLEGSSQFRKYLQDLSKEEV